jgi:hypothetical protein
MDVPLRKNGDAKEIFACLEGLYINYFKVGRCNTYFFDLTIFLHKIQHFC